MEDAFMKTSDECISYLGVDADRGLSPRQVEDNRKKYGPNGEFCDFAKNSFVSSARNIASATSHLAENFFSDKFEIKKLIKIHIFINVP